MLKRFVVLVGVAAIAPCHGPPQALPTCTSSGACIGCDLSPTFYIDQCPEFHAWCANSPVAPAGRCPGGLVPVACASADPVLVSRCVPTDVLTCQGSAAIACCEPSAPVLSAAFFCNAPSDCPGAPECMAATCLPVAGTTYPQAPGKAGICAYLAQPDSAPCSTVAGDHCDDGACVAYIP